MNDDDKIWVTVVYHGGGPIHKFFDTLAEAVEFANEHIHHIKHRGDTGNAYYGVVSVKIGLYI